MTRDGVEIEVSANLGGAGGAAAAVELGADGVGLLRTEFLFLDRDEIPDEEEQARDARADRRRSSMVDRSSFERSTSARTSRCRRCRCRPSRTRFSGGAGSGSRSITPTLLATQLRAALRVAADHPVKVMFPMVATIDELEAALDAGRSCSRRPPACDAPLEVGIMVEVPSAALAGAPARGEGRLLLDRDERSHSVHDGRGAGQRTRRQTS